MAISHKKPAPADAVHGQTTEAHPKAPHATTPAPAPTARQRLAGLASHLLPQGNTEFDYVIVSGRVCGAGCASSLTAVCLSRAAAGWWRVRLLCV